MIRLVGRLLPLAALLVWEILCRGGAIDTRYLPAPSAILACLAAPGTAGDLLAQTGHTLLRPLDGAAGFGLGNGFSMAVAAFACAPGRWPWP